LPESLFPESAPESYPETPPEAAIPEVPSVLEPERNVVEDGAEAVPTEMAVAGTSGGNVNKSQKPSFSNRVEESKTFLDANPWAATLINIILIVLLTYFLASISRKIWRKNPKNSQFLFRKFLYNILQTCIYVFGALFAVGQIPQLSSIVQTIIAGSGILALAISLSAQESLNNIISGMFITLFKPFEVGDRVTLVDNAITGTIEDITLRHTIIKTFTNTRIIVPNSVINKGIIENSNIVDSRASSFVDVWVAYESDIDMAMRIMAAIIGNHPLFWDTRSEEEKATLPKVKVYVRELGSSGIALRASMWTKTVNENFDACSDVRLQIKKAFDSVGIEIPYTKYTVLHQDKTAVEKAVQIDGQIAVK